MVGMKKTCDLLVEIVRTNQEEIVAIKDRLSAFVAESGGALGQVSLESGANRIAKFEILGADAGQVMSCDSIVNDVVAIIWAILGDFREVRTVVRERGGISAPKRRTFGKKQYEEWVKSGVAAPIVFREEARVSYCPPE